jgi:hypothetical protein
VVTLVLGSQCFLGYLPSRGEGTHSRVSEQAMTCPVLPFGPGRPWLQQSWALCWHLLPRSDWNTGGFVDSICWGRRVSDHVGWAASAFPRST